MAFKVKPLALVGSMDFEIEAYVGQLKGIKEIVIQGVKFLKGVLDDVPVVIVCTGGGKLNAGVTVTLLLEHFSPEAVIFSGVAGGVGEELQPGDVVIGEKTVYHDFGQLNTEAFVVWQTWKASTGEKNPLYFSADVGLLTFAKNAINKVVLQKHNAGLIQQQAKVVEGVIATGDIFCASSKKKAELKERFNAVAVEMDGAAVAQICWHHGVRCLVIRGISDLTDANAYEEYEEFSELAMKNAASLTIEIVKEFKSSF
jgi:adenosylhomocysteine nucleosidase